MGLEAATYISGLNANNPVGASDPKSQGDDHLRLIKSTLLNSFPGVTGAVNATHTELNYLDNIAGVTGTGNLVLSDAPTLTGTMVFAYANCTALTAVGTITAAVFAGSGASLTALNASQLTSGTIPDARIQASGITQHQASLSIAETQIADGAVFPRLAATETVAGAWTFSAAITAAAAITRSGKGSHPYYDSATQSGGAITVSTADASGTPAAGDLWFKYTP